MKKEGICLGCLQISKKHENPEDDTEIIFAFNFSRGRAFFCLVFTFCTVMTLFYCVTFQKNLSHLSSTSAEWENSDHHSKSSHIAFSTQRVEVEHAAGTTVKSPESSLLKQELQGKSSTENQKSSDDDYFDQGQVIRKIYKVDVVSAKTSPGDYAVFCSTTPFNGDYNYPFFLPLTVIAWKKLGFHSIVIIIGRIEVWNLKPALNAILEALLDLECTIIFIDSDPQNHVMLSQSSRLFVTSIINFDQEENTNIVTSDADIWPLDKKFYQIPEDKKILSLNAYCCGNFYHRGEKIRMLPMCNVMMNVKTWKEIMGFHTSLRPPRTATGIIKYCSDMLGDVASRKTEKGENDGWFLDQHLISIKIEEWAKQFNRSQIAYVPRDTGRDRIDRAAWKPFDMEYKIDSHLLEYAYRKGVWEQIRPLLMNMLTEQELKWCDMYRSRVTALIIET